MGLPDLPEQTVAVAWSTAPADDNPLWEDISAYVRGLATLKIDRGRQDELSEIQPSKLSLTLINDDGRFTPDRAASPYYPDVKKSKRIRVSERWPAASVQPGNLITNSTFEVDVAGWQAYGITYGGGSIARSTVRAQEGTASALATWVTFAGSSFVGCDVGGMVVGKTYTASAYVWVPAGNPAVRMARASIDGGAFTVVQAAWVRVSHTFVAQSVLHTIGIEVGATTAGQQVYIDAVMLDEGPTVAAFTTTPPPIFHRFTGYVDEWPLSWADPSATSADIQLTASSRQARMARGTELRSVIEQEYLEDDPKAYYTFGDAEGTVFAGNVAAHTQPTMSALGVGSGGGIVFGQATGPGTDGMTAATYTRVDANNGFYMRALPNEDLVELNDDDLLIECFFNTSTVGSTLVSLVADSGSAQLGISSLGKLTGSGTLFGTVFFLIASAATVSDGATHHAALRQSKTGGFITSELFLDGALAATDTSSADWWPKTRLYAGGSAPVYAGVLAHIAVYNTVVSDARILAHAQAGLTGFSGESSDQRIQRIARYAGVPATEVTVETGLSTSITNQIMDSATPLELMRNVAKTENGVLIDTGDGDLAFHARSHRYNASSAFTLSGNGQAMDSDLAPKLDDQGVANDITASRANGVTVRAVDQASITDIGVYRDQLDLLTTSDNEVYDAAFWALNQRATPVVRVPVCTVNLRNASSALKTAVLSAEVGTRITLDNLPAQAPASSMDFFIEGITDNVTAESYRVSFNLSPASLSGVWQLDSSTYSVLGTSTRLAY